MNDVSDAAADFAGRIAAARHRIEQLEGFLASIPNGLLEVDLATFRITMLNDYARTHLGYDGADLERGIIAVQIVREDFIPQILQLHSQLAGESMVNRTPYQRAERQNSFEVVLRRKDGTTFTAQAEASYVLDAAEVPIGARYFFRDITERKCAEDETQRLLMELQETLSNVKTLRGLLPICAVCKSVRDDRGYWTQIESYVRKNSDVDFSHGICPTCKAEVETR